MTDQQKNQAIADKCPGVSRIDGQLVWLFRNRWIEFDPINDLNAMAVAEATMTGEQWSVYEEFLPEPTFRSTSRQRADAFDKVMGLWVKG